jgi:hypothetical protein
MESWGEFEKLWNKAKAKNGCNPVRITDNYGVLTADAWSYHGSCLHLYRDGEIKAIMNLKVVKRVE